MISLPSAKTLAELDCWNLGTVEPVAGLQNWANH